MMILPAQFALAPMAEVSTPVLRKLIKRFSANVILYSEMLSAKGIVAGGSQNKPLTQSYDFDPPLVYQIEGNSPEYMAAACDLLSEKKPFAMDINMGCPMSEITKRGHGAKLLTDRELARKIVQECRKKTPGNLSVKMRSGYANDDTAYLVDFAKMLQGEGVDFITLHPRYAKLVFTRKADWRLVALLKEHLQIPVIGNGDVSTAEEALSRIAETACDAVMIGREAVKSPWIFNLCNALQGKEAKISHINLHSLFIEALDLIAEMLPVTLHKSRAHRFCGYFAKNLLFSHNLFTKIRMCDTIEAIKKMVDNYFANNSNESIKYF